MSKRPTIEEDQPSKKKKPEYSRKEVTIRLNVGGKKFMIGIDKLTGQEVEKATYFSTILKEEWNDSDDFYFIDRDPTHFQLILNYMRGYTISTLVKNISEENLGSLLQDADFYCLDNLKSMITKEMQKFQKLELDYTLETGGEEFVDFIGLKDGRIMGFTSTGLLKFWIDGVLDVNMTFQAMQSGSSNDDFDYTCCMQMKSGKLVFGITNKNVANLLYVEMKESNQHVEKLIQNLHPSPLNTYVIFIEAYPNYDLCISLARSGTHGDFVLLRNEDGSNTSILENMDLVIMPFGQDLIGYATNGDIMHLSLDVDKKWVYTPLFTPNCIPRGCLRCNISLQGGQFATASKGIINIWKIDGKKRTFPTEEIDSGIDGAGGAGGSVRLLELKDGRILAGTENGFLQVWDLNGKCEQTLLAGFNVNGNFEVGAMVFLVDGRVLSYTSDGSIAKVWKFVSKDDREK